MTARTAFAVAIQTAERHSGIRIGARRYLVMAHSHHPHPSFRPCLAVERLGLGKFWQLALEPRTSTRLRISFGTAFLAALVNAVFGVILAWVLVRYRFPGKRVIDAMVDLPFALPTAVAGIALTTLYAPNGWIGSLLTPLGIKIAFTRRHRHRADLRRPALRRQDRAADHGGDRQGSGGGRRHARRQPLPDDPPRAAAGAAPAVLTGFALAFARGVGEYGSVIFIAGNLPYVSEIAPLLIVIRLEEFNYPAATAIAAVMLVISFAMLFVINSIQAWSRRRYGYGA